MTREQAIKIAEQIVAKYPQAQTVNEAIDLSCNDNFFNNETEMLIVWGRLMRLYPKKVGA